MLRPLFCFLILGAAGLAAAQHAPADSFIVVDGDTLVVAAPIEVLGSRVPAALPGAIRPVGVQTRDDLLPRPLQSVADALDREPSVIASQRQRHGVQADLSIRGSTFEQVEVLLDGCDLSDPQTGHHLLDLPLALQDLARLEVMPGHGSVLYGSGAFGGTVNVVPRRPTVGRGGEVGGLGGPDGTWAVRGNLNLPLRRGEPSALAPAAEIGAVGRGVRISAERFRTDGPTRDGVWSGRDADQLIGTARYLDSDASRLTDVFVGLADRSFGARDFYTPTPAHETTTSLVVTARHRRDLGAAVLEARLAGRRHRDLYVLDRTDPDRYRNDHLSRRALAGLRLAAPVAGPWSLGADLEAAYEDLDSDGIRAGTAASALGQRQRRRAARALELPRSLAPVRLQLGGRLDLRDRLAPRLGGTVAGAWQPRPRWSLHAAAGTVYRVPTFTDLYYVDPYNRGNPDLRPESGWTWDAGARLDTGTWLAAVTYFERYEDDLIEWARSPGDPVWQVQNVADASVQGVEVRAGWEHPRGHRILLGWQNLRKERAFAPGTEAKYDLLTPQQHLTASGTLELPWRLAATLTARHLHRTGGTPDFRDVVVTAARLSWVRGRWTVTLDGDNLLDRRYEDVPGAVMPGRTLSAGATLAY
ncbi:MAG: TonB-dependent receptor [Candidatus Krumholzibacteriia bacterium]